MAVARGLADNTIMQAADWASARTLYANYVRLLPASAVLPEGTSVQQVLVTGHPSDPPENWGGGGQA